MNEPVASMALRALDAIERKEYALGIGLGLMVLTFFVSRAASARGMVPKEYTATVLLGASLLGGFGTALAAGVPPARAAIAFVACSSSAIAFWEAAAKHVVKLWRRRMRRRRIMPPRKLPTILVLATLLVLPATPARAGELPEPGIVLVRPNGTEVRIEFESVLLEREGVAKLDSLLEELEACRKSRENCEREHAPNRSDRKWVFLATILGAFLAGFAAQRQVRITAETVEPP